MIKRIVLLIQAFFLATALFAQQPTNESIEMADVMRSNGKIYVVVAIIAIIMIGFVLYLTLLDKKISRLEKEVHNR